METISNTELLDLLARKDNRAYQRLYSLYYVALKSLAYCYVKDEEVAGDMVQDTFFSLLRQDRKFASVNEVKYFLYASLKNRCISQLRRMQVRHKAQQGLKEEYSQMADYWDMALEEDVYSRLMASVESLPPQCRLVMLLTLEGLKTSEIAERLNISPETVKEHKANGKRKMGAWLKDNQMMSLLWFLLI